MDTENVVGTNPETGAEEDRKPSDDEKTSALAFKIATDPYVGRLTFFRVYSGKIEAGSYIYNSRSGKKERVGLRPLLNRPTVHLHCLPVDDP